MLFSSVGTGLAAFLLTRPPLRSDTSCLSAELDLELRRSAELDLDPGAETEVKGFSGSMLGEGDPLALKIRINYIFFGNKFSFEI